MGCLISFLVSFEAQKFLIAINSDLSILPFVTCAFDVMPKKPSRYFLSFSFLIVTYLFFWWSHRAACGILVLGPRTKPRPSAVKARRPNHWTARKFPSHSFLQLHSTTLQI